MADFTDTITKHTKRPPSEKAQKNAGKPTKGQLSTEHRAFLHELTVLIETRQIDLNDPQTFLKQDVYDSLSDEWKEKADLALLNISTLLNQLYELYIGKDTPTESPQYQTMIEQLFAMKQRIESHHDVFKF